MNPRLRLAQPVAVILLGMTLASCAASERQRPIPTSRIATSGDTLQAARKQFEGKWSLVSLQYAAEDGRVASVDGTVGSLVADAFGNLSIEYRVSEAGLKVLNQLGYKTPSPVISTTGQSFINVDERTIAYVDSNAKPFDPKAAAGRANPFALERTRYYEFGADGVLLLTTRHDDGKNAVVSRWKKG